MGLFDFFKKKNKEELPKQQEEKQSETLQAEGFSVDEADTQDEIVLQVDEQLQTTTAINQAVHEVMDEEVIEFHEKAGGTLYQEETDQTAQTTSFAQILQDAKIHAEEPQEQKESEENVQIEIEAADGTVYEAKQESEGKEFVEEAADFVAEQIEEAIQVEKNNNVAVSEQTTNQEELQTVTETEQAEKETEQPQKTIETPEIEQPQEVVEATETIESVEQADAAIKEEKPKKGLFARLKEGLQKTRQNILGGVDAVLGSFTKIDEDLFEELEEALIMADMGAQTTMDIVENLRQRVKRERTTDPAQIKGMLIDEITAILQDGVEEAEHLPSPTVMLVIGVNGVGKTTTIGKLAHNFKQEGKTVLLAAADTFRAAAIDQLEVWGERAGIEVIKHEENADPAAVVYDAVHAARNRKTDFLICDTAGRLHNKKNLMEELRKISRVIEREYPTAHKETYLVLDATTGQNALQQAKVFMEVADITGIILTKLDGTAKGGIVVAIKSELKIPVRYIGVGESMEDLQKFDAADFAKALFGGETNL